MFFLSFLKVLFSQFENNFCKRSYKKPTLFNPLMPGGNKKVAHTQTNLQLKAAGLFKYV